VNVGREPSISNFSNPHMKQLPVDAKILAKELKPVLDVMEYGRMKSMRRIQRGWKKIGIATLVAGAAVLFIFMMVSSRSNSTQSNGGMLLIIAVVSVTLIYNIIVYSKFINGHASAYKAAYKSKVIGAMTRSIESDMIYFPDRGISEQTFRDSRLYRGDVDRYHSEDLFTGKIGKTLLMFSEAHAEDKRSRTNSKGRSETYWVTIFNGTICVVDFNKKFRSWVTVMPDFAESSFGWLGRKVQGLSGNLVRLESPQFEQAFVVHGGDQVEARYLLTPDFQDRLLELRRWFGDDIRLAFHNSKLHLSIPNSTNRFEPNIKQPAHDLSQMHQFIQQMTSIFRLVEMLDLNTRIWTKQ
jgi:hypothetical protein